MKALSILSAMVFAGAMYSTRAEFKIYTDRSAFLAATTKRQIIDFRGYAGGGLKFYGDSLTIAGVTFISIVGPWTTHGNLYVANLDAYDSRPVLWNYDVVLPLQIVLPPGITAFGADFSATTDTAHQPLGDAFVATISFNDGTSYSFPARKWPFQTFWGFTSDDPVASLSYSDGGAFSGLHFEVMDNVMFGSALSLSNAPPLVLCPAEAIVECGPPVHLTATVTDSDGDPLTVEWTLNGQVVQTNTVAAGDSSMTVSLSLNGRFPIGTNLIGVTAIDAATNRVFCSTAITVVDRTPPAILSVAVEPNNLWPPNHQMKPVHVRADVGDACGSASWRIVEVRSNEPINGPGDGSTTPDWEILGDHALNLRAERSAKGTGRTYFLILEAKDGSGNLSEPAIGIVTVPRSR